MELKYHHLNRSEIEKVPVASEASDTRQQSTDEVTRLQDKAKTDSTTVAKVTVTVHTTPEFRQVTFNFVQVNLPTLLIPLAMVMASCNRYSGYKSWRFRYTL